MDTSDPMLTLEALSDSLDELEAMLEPLFEKPLQQSLEGLDTIQRVRVKSYVEKISELETEPAKRNLVVDQAAANRFIKAAITKVKAKTASSGAAASESDTVVPLGKHLKFLDSKPKAEDSSRHDEAPEDDSLEIHVNEDDEHTSSGRKRKRMDVFAGYGADTPKYDHGGSAQPEGEGAETQELSENKGGRSGSRSRGHERGQIGSRLGSQSAGGSEKNNIWRGWARKRTRETTEQRSDHVDIGLVEGPFTVQVNGRTKPNRTLQMMEWSLSRPR
ncbi:uncharacterized protein EI90DRAFT_3016800 [Cantharellus anzutake]|uniref:uncharacterized protein n=1 Tax=Cantharellus anzutake TaxID=1750568 RepID=UPI001908B00B|nr:uncharacterized protein EI90DRAFT_3016800 [Cantharellus anzutake]KAF8330356.1 hypothetical protein EI90DRAFT_3016800 [Cantharellus anzutake]